MQSRSLDAATLAGAYREGKLEPADVVEDVLGRIAKRGADGVWIALAERERLLDDARALARRRAAGERLPLYGLPFAVKDNISVAGMATTAACPAFAYQPEAHAPVVERLIEAGALVIGKTNLDQFATGLVGVRSPYGIPRNLFDPRYIVGGSSSGSAVSVAAGLVSFALGSDTAGSGRVPAAFNNIVGLKPSRGLLSTTGVVPACRSLDCVSVFAATVEEAVAVADVARGYDPADPASRPEADTFRFGAAGPRPPRFRFGVPAGAALDFLGDGRAADLFRGGVAQLEALGGVRVALDFAPFEEASGLLYDGPFVAERLEAGGRLLAENPAAIVAPVRAIFEGATRFDARAAFAAGHRLAMLRRRAAALLGQIDFLFVPTTPTIYTIEEIEADPLRLNAKLGRYANFVNLLDLAALAVPLGFRSDGLPGGATLIAPWGRDATLAAFASALHRATSRTLGATGAPLRPAPDGDAAPDAGDRVEIAVVGAHLSGEPLNHQLVDLGARFVRATRTLPAYRLYALPGTSPPKPGMMRVQDSGVAIDLELWSLDAKAFGQFVSRVPAPLCIGTLALEDGTRASGFLCEGHALVGALDISRFGGWRGYLRSLN